MNATKYKITVFVILAWLLVIPNLKAQNNFIDSLKNELKTAGHDTTKCKILLEMTESEENPDIWPKFNEELLHLAEINLKKCKSQSKEYILYKTHYVRALRNVGYRHSEIGEIEEAKQVYKKCIELHEEINDLHGLAGTLNNLASIYEKENKLTEGLLYYKKSQECFEKLNEADGIAVALNNAGLLHDKLGNTALALENYDRAIHF